MIAKLPWILTPLAAAALALLGGILMIVLPREAGAVVCLALWTAVTMASGERGLADLFPKLRLLGGLLAACTILLRWYALLSLATSTGWLLTTIVAALTAAWAASAGLAWVSPPVDPPAVARVAGLTTTVAIAVMAQGAVAAAVLGPRLAVLVIVGSYLLVRLGSAFFKWRFAGIRATDIDAFRVVCETALLVLLASVGGPHGIMGR